jgi:hypothetical protein
LTPAHPVASAMTAHRDQDRESDVTSPTISESTVGT